MAKVVWVALPLALFGIYVAARALGRRGLSRHALNVLSSLLLLAYVAVTAGLGVFWVANQQLPVFDWHYLFGYATVLLVVVHLAFNARILVRHFTRGGAPARRPAPARGRAVASLAGVLLACAAAFALGMRHGGTDLSIAWGADGAAAGGRAEATGPMDVVEQYHALSSHTRQGVLARAPSVDWGEPPPPFKAYAGLPRTPLPPPGGAGAGRAVSEALTGPPAAAPPGARLDLAALSAILFHAAGVTERRGGIALRASPSSGALFSTELYVAARDVAGLERGLYHYDPEQHALTRLAAPEPSAADLGAPGDAAAAAAPAVVAVTAVFRRTGNKYRDRAYRYVLADAGHALENLRVAAAEMGRAARLLRRFDEARAAAALGVDGVEEGPIALVSLADALAAPGDPPIAFAAAPAPEAASDLGITGVVHRATSLSVLAVPPPAPPGASAPLRPLPPPAPASGRVFETIAARRSHRDFTRAPLPLADLGAVLHEATRASLASRAVRVHVVAHRVADLPAGAFQYDPAAHALAEARLGDLRGEAQGAALAQEVIGDAAAVVVLSLDRDAMRAEGGARAYRHAFLEAGAIGERLYLGAGARGLGACAVGAFYDDEAARLVGVAPERAWVVHFAALGHIDPID